MSKARVRRRYQAYLRYIYRCAKLGATPRSQYGGAYERLLDRVWEE
jgi:hypothetical protein